MQRIAIALSFLFLALAASPRVAPAQAPPVQITSTPVAAGDWAQLCGNAAMSVLWADGGTVRLRRSMDGGAWGPEQVWLQGGTCSDVSIAGNDSGAMVASWRVAKPAGDDIVVTWSETGAVGTWLAPVTANLRTGGTRRMPRVTTMYTFAGWQIVATWCEGAGDVYCQRLQGGVPAGPEVLVHGGSAVAELGIVGHMAMSILPPSTRAQVQLAWRDGTGAATSVRSAMCFDAAVTAPTFVMTTHATGRVDGVQGRSSYGPGSFGNRLEHFVVWRERHGGSCSIVADGCESVAATTVPVWSRARCRCRRATMSAFPGSL